MIELTASRAALLAQLPRETLTSGMSNAAFCNVTFDSSWDGLTKIAVFTNGRRSVDVPEADWNGNTFPVPAEVLTTPGLNVWLGLYGTDGETVVLPTVWCSLGTVREGADPSGADNLEAESPVWAQVLARQEALEKSAGRSALPYTTLTRDGKAGTVTVHFHGLVAGERYALYLYTANRRNGRRQKAWRHTPNYDFDDENRSVSRKGYGRLAGTAIGCLSDNGNYPSVPDWMPNDGYLQTEWEVPAGAQEFKIYLKRWLLPMLKPIVPSADDPWKKCGMIGLGTTDKASLLMQWRLVRLDDGAVGECRDTLKVGAPKVPSDGICLEIDYIRGLYTAIV